METLQGVYTPELTVSMPAYNTAKYVGEAIECVLRQDGIDFELVVVDDGSQDNTAEVVLSFNDQRVKLIRNNRNMGIAYCHNLVIERSNSPFIAHVDSDDLVLPGAFKRMVDKLKSDSTIGQVHCRSLSIDEAGGITRDAFRRRIIRQLTTKRPDMDYKRALLVYGGSINHLRTYRRDVFSVVGKFNEELRYGEDYEMALRIVDKFHIRLVTDFLYCKRDHSGRTTAFSRHRRYKFFLNNLSIRHQLIKRHQIRFPWEKKYNSNRLTLVGLYYNLGLHNISDVLATIFKRVHTFLHSQLQLLINRNVYHSVTSYFSRWPINLFSLRKATHLATQNRTAYYLLWYPMLSMRFNQREVMDLRRSGLSAEVIEEVSEVLKPLSETEVKIQEQEDTMNKLLKDIRQFSRDTIGEFILLNKIPEIEAKLRTVALLITPLGDIMRSLKGISPVQPCKDLQNITKFEELKDTPRNISTYEISSLVESINRVLIYRRAHYDIPSTEIDSYQVP